MGVAVSSLFGLYAGSLYLSYSSTLIRCDDSSPLFGCADTLHVIINSYSHLYYALTGSYIKNKVIGASKARMI